MSSGFGGGGGITSLIAGAGINILNPGGPSPTISTAGGAMCADYANAGTVEIANQAETFAGTVLGGSGCYLAVNPVNLLFKLEAATNARFMDFTAGVVVAAGFGTNALDIQSNRGLATQIASGFNAIAIGQSNVASGNDSIGIGNSHSALGIRGITIGSTCTAGGDNCSAIGYRNTAGNAVGPAHEATAIGRSNFATAQASCAFGVLNNVLLPGNIGNATGVIIGDPQVVVAYGPGINSTTIGVANTMQGLRGTAIGFKNNALFGMINSDLTLVGSQNVANVLVGPYCSAMGYANQLTAGTFSSAFGSRNTMAAFNAIVAGDNCYCASMNGSVFGYGSYAGGFSNNVALGRSCFVSGYSAVAVGVMNNVAVPANLDNDFGLIAGDPQAINAPGVNSSALGVGNQASGLRSGAIGFKNVASGQDATALGSQGVARVQQTTNVAGAIIVRRDGGEAAAAFSDSLQFFAGTEDLVLTPEIDFTAAPADYTIALPANCHFLVNEVGIILTTAVAALVTQPTVRFGITGTPAKLMAATLTTLLTAIYKRERFWTLLADDAEASLLFGVTVSAAAGTLVGRAYFKGILLEDE